MKKQILLLMFMLSVAVSAFAAEEAEIGDLRYELDSRTKKAKVINNNYSGSIVIPETVEYGGTIYNVTSIGSFAFSYCSNLTSITIPNSVESIEFMAFNGCSSLTFITIPNRVTNIGDSAFENCSGLSTISIPNSVTSIGNRAFSGCSGLSTISIPSNVTSMGYSVFSDCSGLKSVTIQDGVKRIGENAFRGCSSLKSVTIPSSLTSIEKSAFYNCSSLNKVHISDLIAWCKVTFGDYWANPIYYAHNLFLNGEKIRELVIPSNVTSIRDYAFYNCSSLESVTIPNSLKSIGSGAFSGCSGLSSITIPSSVTSIGLGAFSNCSGMISITIPNSVMNIESSVFSGCSGLTSVTIPNSVTSIGGNAFKGCTSLTSITIPNSVTSIGSSAFRDCSGLKSAMISNSVTNIGSYAFENCIRLKSIIIPNSVTSIGSYAFMKCRGLTTITIGSEVKTIYTKAFAYCPELTDVYCYAENTPSMKDSQDIPCTDAFEGSQIESATLHVLAASINAYKAKKPWNSFKTIMEVDESMPEVKKCATPTISYGGKKLTFSCETEGVEYVYEIMDTDIKKGNNSEVQLTATYEISVYATKEGWENSDEATATLIWGTGTFTETTPDQSSVSSLTFDTSALITASRGVIIVKTETDGLPVAVYAINGRLCGSANVSNGQATIPTTLKDGNIAIVRFGNYAVKVMMK